MEWQHPILQEMLQLGCSDQGRVMLAFQTYMKLCEVDNVNDAEFFYDEVIGIIYLHSVDKGKKVLHIPVTTKQTLTPAWLHQTRSALLAKHPDASVNVILKTPDTSLLSYRISEDLCPPQNPESAKEKKVLQEKIQYVQNELYKRKLELFEEAKLKRQMLSSVITSENTSIAFKEKREDKA